MAINEASPSSSKSDTDSEEVFSHLSRSEMQLILEETFEKNLRLQKKLKEFKKELKVTKESFQKLTTSHSDLSKEISVLKTEKETLKNDFDKLESEVTSDTESECKSKLYEKAFQKFLAQNVERSKMASMIYGVSRSNKEGIGYTSSKIGKWKPKQAPKIDHKALYSHFAFSHVYNAYTPEKSKVPKSKYGNQTNRKGPKKIWVPKDKIIYVADILSSTTATPVMVPGLWVLTTHDGKKAYVPKPGT